MASVTIPLLMIPPNSTPNTTQDTNNTTAKDLVEKCFPILFNSIVKPSAEFINDLKKIDDIRDLKNRNITTLNGNAFKHLEKLTYLDLSCNKIQNLPAGIFRDETNRGLPNLRKIIFDHNGIEKLEMGLFQNLDLRVISFNDNKISELGKDLFQGLKKTTNTTNTTNTKKTPKPPTTECSIKLDAVFFRNNKIKKLEDGLFNGLTNLKTMYFDYNSIDSLGEHLFRELISLETISFSHNDITCLPEKIFQINDEQSLNQLKTINFSSNEITQLKNGLFKGFTDLQLNFHIDFRNNFFNFFDTKLFYSLLFSDLKQKNEYDESISSRFPNFNFLKLSDNGWRKHKQVAEISLILHRNGDMNKIKQTFLFCCLNKKIRDKSFFDEFNASFAKFESYEWFLLDFLLSLDEDSLSNEFLRDLNSYIQNELAQNKSLVNLDFQIKSPKDSIKRLIERDSIDLLDLPIQFVQEANDLLKHIIEKKDDIKSREIKNKFLLHDTISNLAKSKWKPIPCLTYSLNIIIYLVFLISYSINICAYTKFQSVNKNKNIQTKDTESIRKLFKESKTFSLVFISILFSLEIIKVLMEFIKIIIFICFHCKDGTKKKMDQKDGKRWIKLICKIWKDFRKIKLSKIILEIIELVTFPLCIHTLDYDLCSNEIEIISSLYSVTILASYFILVKRLDKVPTLGPYVKVFGKIIKRSLPLLIILAIIIIGFSLSFMNRSTYYLKTNYNETQILMSRFNGTFEFNLIQLLTFMTGGLQTENMGIEKVHLYNLVNFLIYLVFIFFMTILFLNMFTGISIDQVQDLIKNAEAETIEAKIKYILVFDTIFSPIYAYERLKECTNNCECFKTEKQVLAKEKSVTLENLNNKLDSLNEKIENLQRSSKQEHKMKKIGYKGNFKKVNFYTLSLCGGSRILSSWA
jgi:hypothetical protein